MIQCEDCEFSKELSNGSLALLCHPGRNIKEPECLSKLQLQDLQVIKQYYARIDEVLPRVEAILNELGIAVCHVNNIIEKDQQADDWKRDSADEDDEPA